MISAKKTLSIKLFIISTLLSFFLVLHVSALTIHGIPIYETAVLHMLSSDGEAQMLSSVIVSRHGTIIVVDGGWTYDAEKLAGVIKRYGSCVDAWLITHPDPDHSGALYQLLQDNLGIDIKNIYCSLAEDSWYEEHAPDISSYVKEFKNTLSKKPVIAVKRNDILHIEDIKICVLNDRYEFQNNCTNNSSIVYKVLLDDTTILYLGDLGYEGGERLLAETPSYLLSSDIVQMAHHGQAGVSQKVYEAIDPKIALWSTPQWLWTNENGTGSYSTLIVREWMDIIGCKNYVTADGDIVLDLENIIQNNKFQN